MMIFTLASSLFLSAVQQGQAMHGKCCLCNCSPFLQRQSECSQRAVISLYSIQRKCWPSSTKKSLTNQQLLPEKHLVSAKSFGVLNEKLTVCPKITSSFYGVHFVETLCSCLLPNKANKQEAKMTTPTKLHQYISHWQLVLGEDLSQLHWC